MQLRGQWVWSFAIGVLINNTGCILKTSDQKDIVEITESDLASDPDTGKTTSKTLCYIDKDGDGYGSKSTASIYSIECDAEGYSSNNNDCDDSNEEKNIMQSCYEDNDSDGWGGGSRKSLCAPSSCFSSNTSNNSGDDGWDNDADVHPEMYEIAEDGKDNDLDGKTDESEPIFYMSGYNNTSNGFDIILRLNSSTLISESSLYAKVTYYSLEASNTQHVTGYKSVTRSSSALHEYAIVSVSGLASNTIYKAEVAFYKLKNGSYEALNVPSDTYYTMTKASSSPTNFQTARHNIVLHGLEDWDDVAHGALDDSDMTVLQDRYDLSSTTDAWCSEWYVTMAKDQLKYFNTSDEGSGDSQEETYVSAVNTWFEDYNMSISYTDLTSLTDRGPGVWLGVDSTSGCDGNANHTEMYLGYDHDTGEYWSLNGNSKLSGSVERQNRVDIVSRSTTCTDSGDVRILHIGKINNTNQLDNP